MEQVKYTQKDILERVFKQKRMGVGYDPADVDSFLDDIIKDYGVFGSRVEQLKSEVVRLQVALKDAQDQLVAVKQQPVQTASQPQPVEDQRQAAVTNLDLIKRVANLERVVFGRDHNSAE